MGFVENSVWQPNVFITGDIAMARRLSVSGENNPAYKHGHTESKFSPEYHSWSSMIQRCTNSTRASWKYYGGKGITVCDRWIHSFEAFLEDMGLRPEGMTLDRIDGDKGYFLENCRWATKKEQSSNRSKRTDGYTQDILCIIMAGHGFLPDIVEYMKLHREVVKKSIRALRGKGLISTYRVASYKGCPGRTLMCVYNYKGD